jgi:hypothetical protein
MILTFLDFYFSMMTERLSKNWFLLSRLPNMSGCICFITDRSIGQHSARRAGCQNAQPSPLSQVRSKIRIISRCLSAIKLPCGQPVLRFPAFQGVYGKRFDGRIPCCAREGPLSRISRRHRGASPFSSGSGCESGSRWAG